MTKRGTMFSTIFQLFEEGKTADGIIAQGYAHSTVYWVKKQIEKGRTSSPVSKDMPGWVKAGLRAGWIHRCDDNKLGIIEDKVAYTRQGVISFRQCTVCKTVIDAEFSKRARGDLSDQELRGLSSEEVEFTSVGELLQLASQR